MIKQFIKFCFLLLTLQQVYSTDTFEISFKTAVGKDLKLGGIKEDTTVAEVKKMLEDKEGIPPECQKLVCGEVILKDANKFMSDYNAGASSTVQIIIDISDKRGSSAHENRDNFSIFVKDLQGKTITIDGVSYDTSILAVKKKIVDRKRTQDKVITDIDLIRLIFAGKQLLDQETLNNHNILRDSTIKFVQKKGLEIIAKGTQGESIKFLVNYSMRVAKLKQEIRKELGIDSEKKLRFSYGNRELQDDEKGIGEYCDRHLSSIIIDVCEEQFLNKIIVKNKETSSVYPFNNIGMHMTILELKEYIADKSNIWVSTQSLSLDNKVLKNEGTLSSCGIQEDAEIALSVKLSKDSRMQADLYKKDGTFLTFNSSSVSGQDAFEAIQALAKNHVKYFKIAVRDKNLTMKFVQNQEELNQVLQYVPNLNSHVICIQEVDVEDVSFNIYVQDSEGRKVELYDVDDEMLIADIKQKITEKAGPPVGEQVLHFNDTLLEDKKNIFFYKIQENDIIHLSEKQVNGDLDSDKNNNNNQQGDSDSSSDDRGTSWYATTSGKLGIGFVVVAGVAGAYYYFNRRAKNISPVS